MVVHYVQWKLYAYSVRTFEDGYHTITQYNYEWLDTTLFLKPDDFIQIDDYERTYTTWELIEQIQEQKLKGFSNITALWIEIHRRTADAVTSFLLTILAVSISSRKVRGGLGLHLAADRKSVV